MTQTRIVIMDAAGRDFRLIDPDRMMLNAEVPVVAVDAGRTGCGKSQTARKLAEREEYESHIDSGAATPSTSSAFATVVCAAATSASRARRRLLPASRTGHSR